MVSGLQAKDYEGKLKELNLQTLSERRERFDMIQTYKFVHKVDNVSPSTWFDFDKQTYFNSSNILWTELSCKEMQPGHQKKLL